jgi:hypothetical protein
MSRPSRVLAAALAVAAGLGAGSARANEKQECADAYEKAQELRMAHDLVGARARLLVCARPTCPKAAYDDCTRWLGEVEASLPTAVVRVRGTHGEALADVRVLLDGQPSEPAARGEEIPLNPGSHTVRVEAAGHAPAESTFELVAVEKGHLVSFALAEAPAEPVFVVAPATQPRRAKPILPAIVAVTVGAVALGCWGYFGIRGIVDRGDVDASHCLPHCPGDQVAHVNGELLAADVSLGVAIVALGVAAWLWLSGGSDPAAARATPVLWEARF